MRLLPLLILTSGLAFAETWSGYLVDSKCYAEAQTNINKDASTVERDMSVEIRQCSPRAGTKDFSVVLPNWDSLKFDSAGNAKAAEIVRSANPKPMPVTVTGNRNRDAIRVDSISAGK